MPQPLPPRLATEIGEFVDTATRLPEILDERCVHALAEVASCRACVDACHAEAWRIEDEALSIDPGRCDGCGVCGSACPQHALLFDDNLSPRTDDSEIVVLVACDQIRTETHNGRIPCLHALGIRELWRLYEKGVQRFIVARPDCNNCKRAQNAVVIERTIRELNALLESRGLAPVRVEFLPAGAWEEMAAKFRKSPPGPSVSRRRLLRGSTGRIMASKQSLPEQVSPAERVLGPGELLPISGPDDVHACVPEIDPIACRGCDACVRLCPQNAIVFDGSDGRPRYRISAERCTGCGLCSDVCETSAIHVLSLQPQRQYAVALRAARCDSCGSPFNLPEESSLGFRICPICQRKGYNRKLFQVRK